MILMKVFWILFSINASYGFSTPESPSYIAGVVEYQVDQGLTTDDSLWTSTQMFQYNAGKYIDILYSAEAINVDILVFPENTLNRQDTAVVIPMENEFHIDLCTNDNYNVNLRNIACAAKSLRKYVVINLTTKWNCTERVGESNSKRCTSEWELYNTNVVMNRDGVIISIYRKYNLFGEPGITQPDSIEYKTFDTDFGVKFGHFVCFDLMFESPAMDFVRNGVKNIVFPTRWYSELPFITAIQVQQNWAHVNDVNFLAAGANLPILGTTGSGIYSGKLGALTSIMTGDNTTKLLVHEVSKVPGDPILNASQIFLGSHFDDLTLYQDEFDGYTYMLVNTNAAVNQSFDLCSSFKEERFCCNFNIATTEKKASNGTIPYTYMAVVFNGWRHFNYFTYEGVKVCAVVACENENVLSCGKRFSTTTEHSGINFNLILIEGTFSHSSIFTMPTSLDFNISSLPTSKFEFRETGYNFSMSLQGEHSQLLAFGIYARDFRYSSKENPNSAITLLVSGSFILLSIISALVT